jgi:hypothetical protein
MRRDLAVLALIVLLHCALFESGLGGSDGWGYFANVESLVEDHDLDLANNLSPRGKAGAQGEVGTFEGRLGGMPHPGIPGRVVNSYPLGKAVLDVPFYLLGKAAGALVPRLRFPEMRGTPYEGMPPRRMLCALGIIFESNLFAAASVVLGCLTLLRLGFSRGVAFSASLLSFFASPLPYYAVNAMSHASATFVSAAILLYWAGLPRDGSGGGGPSRRQVFLLGLLVGAATGLRYAGAGLAPVLGLLLLRGARGGMRRTFLDRLLPFGLGVFSLVWAEGLRNWIELGRPWQTMYPSFIESLVWRQSGLAWVDYLPVVNLFVSGWHGILAWSPLVGVALWGLARGGATGARREALWMAWALFLGQALLPGIGGSFHAGSGFSQRYLCESMPCWALGLAVLLERGGAPLRKGLALAVLAAWNYGLFLLTHAHLCRLSVKAGGTREGWILSDYLYAFDRGMGPGELFSRVLGSTVPGQLGRPWLALPVAAVALWAMGWLCCRGRIRKPGPGPASGP